VTVYRIAADIGGTFTDIACLSPDGALSTYKIPSTPDDLARAVAEGICAIAARLGMDGGAFSEVLHASTVATNAILEGKGAVTALVTTEGFRDVLELRRIRVPRLYEPLYSKPAPLVPRRRRYEVSERLGPKGEVLKILDIPAMTELASRLALSEVEAVAVCFLHSYINPAHELEAAAILRRALPGRFISVSSDVLPEIREYERTSTTVVNAYIGPVVARYLGSLQERLRQSGIGGRLLMMQSSGGALDVERVIATPARIVESGPAAGVTGAAYLGVIAGYRDIITFDMGGTTAKASLIEDGRVVTTDEYEVGGGISLSSKLAKGGGYALKLPVIDVAEVGAGGGSIVWVDPGGALKVGPRSAGAVPGPACYGAGGEHATVTDANVVLGFLNQRALAGGAVAIHADAARAALSKIGAMLNCDVLEAAYGVHRLANATMMRAVKAVSTYRGRDPRDFTLFAFGGNGGVHAAALARELQIRRVVVPPGAGVFSAVGLLFANIEVTRSVAFPRPLEDAAPGDIESRFRELEARVVAELDGGERAKLSWRADLRYAGQGFELSVDVAPGISTDDDISAIRQAFEREHLRSYGHLLDGQRIDLVTLRVIGSLPHGPADRLAAPPPEVEAAAYARPVYFGAEHGLCDTPVIGRGGLRQGARPGPLVIEEYEGTTIVPPDATASLDAYNNIVIDLNRGNRDGR
jgi:N-methylhydantoinase A